MSEVEREQIRRHIEEIVSQHWDQTHKALLLSKMGSPIKRAFPNAYAVMEMKLRDFVRTCPKLHLVEHPLIREKIGAIPAGAAIPENVIELFDRERSASPGSETSPFFARIFWRAFHTPLVERRYAIPADENHPVRIVEGVVEDGETAYEILESDISLLPPEAPLVEKVRSVSDKIRAWLKRNNLSGQQFRDQPDRATQQSRSTDSVAKPPMSLTEALADLHPSDQARISIPLDIVLKMLSRRR